MRGPAVPDCGLGGPGVRGGPGTCFLPSPPRPPQERAPCWQETSLAPSFSRGLPQVFPGPAWPRPTLASWTRPGPGTGCWAVRPAPGGPCSRRGRAPWPQCAAGSQPRDFGLRGETRTSSLVGFTAPVPSEPRRERSSRMWLGPPRGSAVSRCGAGRPTPSEDGKRGFQWSGAGQSLMQVSMSERIGRKGTGFEVGGMLDINRMVVWPSPHD
ncbi:PREDICTED: translation initiation factor IF-2-like [Chinchilla lanigera]|uniref:translation initiation factor IF-2-like n=1 Tax=Chinchilla lanigera TaxID=34839 RepID=UPI0006969620|nr:PREDICTED: translation initiation factor IF-2-like [Chinchilla lanigera]